MSRSRYLMYFCLCISCLKIMGCALTRDGDKKTLNSDARIETLAVTTSPQALTEEVPVAVTQEPEPDIDLPAEPDLPVIIRPLVAPPAFKIMVMGKPANRLCEPPKTPYTGDLVFPSKYEGSDSSRDTLNLEAEQKYLQLTADIKLLESLTSSWSDRYLEGDLAARECALSMLEQWAINNALLTDSINEMGQSVRKWALATVAISYLKLTQTSSTPPMSERLTGISKNIIEDWLVLVAEAVREHYSDRPINKVNNHDYWAAWAVMATSVISNREDLFNWALAKFHQGIEQIDEQGFLPNELKRETRALSYHNYALQPLVWMAVFSEVNGRGLNESQYRALSQLAESTITGLNNPAVFENLTGFEQYIEGLETSYNLAWIEVWVSTFPALSGMTEDLDRLRPMKSTRLGGNVSLLFNGSSMSFNKVQKRKTD